MFSDCFYRRCYPGFHYFYRASICISHFGNRARRRRESN